LSFISRKFNFLLSIVALAQYAANILSASCDRGSHEPRKKPLNAVQHEGELRHMKQENKTTGQLRTDKLAEFKQQHKTLRIEKTRKLRELCIQKMQIVANKCWSIPMLH
jgi:hypothetical protein